MGVEEEEDEAETFEGTFGSTGFQMEETEEEAVIMRSERLKRAMRQQEEEDNDVGFLPLVDEEDFDGEDDTSEGDSEDDSVDEANDWGTFAPRAAIQPRFVSKEKRLTIDKEKAIKEEEAKKMQKVKQLDDRKIRYHFIFYIDFRSSHHRSM